MSRLPFLGLLVLFCIGGLACRPTEDPSTSEKPNILLIVVDDLGKEWISAYGSETVETPNVDRLAATGLRFENAYGTPQCTPSRVTLLTGQYPFRHGWTNHHDVPRWGSGAHFDPDRNASFARVLRRAGYATAIAGKWQIDDFRVEPKALHEAGFDSWAVWTGGEGGNIEKSDHRYWEPYVHKGTAEHTASVTRDQFGPDLFTDHLIGFMKRHKDEPMLLYYPMVLTHKPMITTPASPDVSGQDAKFKAMVRYMDTLVGRLIDALETQGLRDETIIIFTTDNGSPRSQVAVRNGHEVHGAKTHMREAGVALPFIVSAPGLVPQGKVTDALTDFTDILPTLAELGGTEPSDHWVVDGGSVAPLLLGKTAESPRSWVYAQGGGFADFKNDRVVPAQPFDNRVIRGKRWKLWVNKQREPTKLYDLKTDPWETHNLIDSDDPEAQAAKQRLWSVIQQMPRVDGAPRYAPTPKQPWDKYDYAGPEEAPEYRFRGWPGPLVTSPGPSDP